jgi:hypothetical protein
MRNIANEKLDIIVNLSKLIDAEIRDERGITKLVIPISAARLNLTEFGNVNLRLIAIPMRENQYGATHLIKVASHSGRIRDKKNKDIIGSIYLSGKHQLDAEKVNDAKAKRTANIREKTRANKYKGIDF